MLFKLSFKKLISVLIIMWVLLVKFSSHVIWSNSIEDNGVVLHNRGKNSGKSLISVEDVQNS